jgi:GNAT superfamily N-acetyltransferase
VALVPKIFARTREKVALHPLLISRPVDAEDDFCEALGITGSLLPPNEYEQLAAHHEGLPMNVYSRRAAEGDYCLALRANGSLVSYQWISLQRAGMFLGFKKEILFRELAEGQAYCYDFYTYKAYRNQGYGTLLKSCLFSHLYDKSVTRLFTCVHPGNHASLAVQLKYGFKLEEMIYCYRVMDWSFSFSANEREIRSLQQWYLQYQQFLSDRRAV